MRQFEKLDLLLSIISRKKDFISSKDLYSEINEKIDSKELTPIVNKLYLDGYIEKKISGNENNSNLKPPYFCRTTFSGLLFIEKGGYNSEYKKRNRDAIWTKSKTILNSLNAIIILIIAALGVYVSWDSKKKDMIIETDKLKIDSLKLEIDNLKKESDTLRIK